MRLEETITVERTGRSIAYRGSYRGGVLTIIDHRGYVMTPEELGYAVGDEAYERSLSLRRKRALELCKLIFGGFVADEERGDDQASYYATRLHRFHLRGVDRTEQGVRWVWEYETFSPYTD
jgi:hypothetical protein